MDHNFSPGREDALRERGVVVVTGRCPNPACGTDDVRTVLERRCSIQVGGRTETVEFRFAYCRACGLGYVDPQPAPHALDAFYPFDYAYWDAPRERLSLAIRVKYALARWRHLPQLRRGLFVRLASRIARLAETALGRDASFTMGIPLALPRISRILDFGFGAGDYLLALRALGHTGLWGCDVERNRRNLDRLQAAGIRAVRGDAFACLPDREFDCIRLEHVLEHLPAPIETLAALRGKLRPGAHLVLTVPSIHAWEPVEGLAESAHLDHLQLPIHLWHHSMRSLGDFLSAAELEVIEVRRLRPSGYLSALARRAGT